MKYFGCAIYLAVLSVKTMAQQLITLECFQDVEFTLFENGVTSQQGDESCSTGRLSAARSFEEYSFLIDMLSRASVTENFWLGEFSTFYSKILLLGLVAEATNIFLLAFPDITFTDRSSDGLEFVNEFNTPPWDPNVDAMVGNLCVFWRVEDNLWSVDSCSGTKSFLCRTDGCSTLSPTTNPTSAPVVIPSSLSPTLGQNSTNSSPDPAHISLEIYVSSMIGVGSMLFCALVTLIRFQKIESNRTHQAVVLNAQNSLKEQLKKVSKSRKRPAHELDLSEI